VDRAFGHLESLLAASPSSRWATASGKLSAEWESFRKGLNAAYEDLAAQLKREAVRVPALRPTNHTRSLFHAACGLSSLALLLFVLTPRGRVWAALLFAGTFWFLELLRRVSPPWNDRMMAFFKHMAHDYERHRVNSSTWFATALVFLAMTLSLRACAVGVAVLALADPAAGFIGRRFGRTKLYGNKSLQGSLTFLVVGTGAAAGALLLGGLGPTLGAVALFALAGALPATVAELYTSRWDDNFTIPVTAGLGVTALELLLR
jgi:dolichol kinase